MKIMLRVSSALLGLGLIGMCWFWWRADVEPVTWVSAPDPGFSGVWSPNNRLSAMKLLFEGEWPGPEDIAQDKQGRFYTGLEDGRIMRFDLAGRFEEFSHTRGRPLGLAFDATQNLIVADAIRGLVSVSPDGVLRELVSHYGGEPLRFVDDVDVSDDGRIWFSDASERFSYDDSLLDIIEGRGTGRLFSFSPQDNELRLWLSGLRFANGVALGPDDEFLVVTETGAARLHRLWIAGERSGQSEIFHSGLPGYPDNISYDEERQLFWLALHTPRSRSMEALGDWPMIRRVVAGMPSSWWAGPGAAAIVARIDHQGRPLDSWQHWYGPYHSVTSVHRFGENLLLGSNRLAAIARIELARGGPR